MKSLLDDISPLSYSASNIVADNDTSHFDPRPSTRLINVTLAPGHILNRWEKYDDYRAYIASVLTTIPYMDYVNVHEQESLLGNPWFRFDFEPHIQNFSQILRMFRTLFSIIDYLRTGTSNIEKAYIYLNEINAEFPTLYNVSGPDGSMRQIEEAALGLFGIKRPEHTIAVPFGFGKRLVKSPKIYTEDFVIEK